MPTVKPWLLAACLLSGALTPGALPAAPAAPSATARAGAPAFDFNFGVWKTHIRRFPDPFAKDPQAVELTGTVTVHKLWGGRGQIEEIEADGPKGHWEGLTTF